MKKIRLVQEEDAERILAIYKPYIKETAVTFEYHIPSLSEFAERIKNISVDYPYLVCVSNGNIAGYAYAHRHMERDAYQWNAELSVYIDENYLRCGLGSTLYSALIDILRLQNICNVYGCVVLPNTNSEKMHEYLGFSKLATHNYAGYKCGRWHSEAWYRKHIGDHSQKPELIIPFNKIDKKKVAAMLDHYNESLNSKMQVG